MQHQDTTIGRQLVNPALPLAHSLNTDAPGHWEAREAALVALRDAYVAEGWPVAEAARLALWHLDERLEAEQAAAPAPASPARERARNKAAYHLAGGLELRRAGGAWLVPSGTRGGVVHRVEGGLCSCEAGSYGRACWHVEAVAQVEAGAFTPLAA